jgi:glycosyltransferase involved in cell wall biosynthesis
LLTTLNMPEMNLRVVDQLGTHSGNVPAEYIRDIYRAADALLLPSQGEGCGLPLYEAQACGTPPISTQWTAMRDHNWSGWQIDTTLGKPSGDLLWNDAGGFYFRPSQRAILQCLQLARAHRGDPVQQQAAIQGAKEFDIQHVIDTYWLPALEQIESLIKGARLFAIPGVPKA